MLGLVWGNFMHHCRAAFIWTAVCECQWSDSSNLLSSSSDLQVLPAVSPGCNILTSCFPLTLLLGLLSGMPAPPALVFPKGHGGRCWDGLHTPERYQWAARPKTTRPRPPGTTWWNSESLHRQGTCRLKHNWAALEKFTNCASCVKA